MGYGEVRRPVRVRPDADFPRPPRAYARGYDWVSVLPVPWASVSRTSVLASAPTRPTVVSVVENGQALAVVPGEDFERFLERRVAGEHGDVLVHEVERDNDVGEIGFVQEGLEVLQCDGAEEALVGVDDVEVFEGV